MRLGDSDCRERRGPTYLVGTSNEKPHRHPLHQFCEVSIRLAHTDLIGDVHHDSPSGHRAPRSVHLDPNTVTHVQQRAVASGESIGELVVLAPVYCGPRLGYHMGTIERREAVEPATRPGQLVDGQPQQILGAPGQSGRDERIGMRLPQHGIDAVE